MKENIPSRDREELVVTVSQVNVCRVRKIELCVSNWCRPTLMRVRRVEAAAHE